MRRLFAAILAPRCRLARAHASTNLSASHVFSPLPSQNRPRKMKLFALFALFATANAFTIPTVQAKTPSAIATRAPGALHVPAHACDVAPQQ